LLITLLNQLLVIANGGKQVYIESQGFALLIRLPVSIEPHLVSNMIFEVIIL
jgi:hypothetical protein